MSSASAVQSPSPCAEIALARFATQKPEDPKIPTGGLPEVMMHAADRES